MRDQPTQPEAGNDSREWSHAAGTTQHEEEPSMGESAQSPRHTTGTLYNPTAVKLQIWQNQRDKIRTGVTLLGCPEWEVELECPGPPFGGSSADTGSAS